MIQDSLTKGTGGNISIFVPDKNLMAITPSGIDYLKLNPEAEGAKCVLALGLA